VADDVTTPEETVVDTTGAASAHPALAAVAATVPSAVFDVVLGDPVARVEREDYLALFEALEDEGFEAFSDLCVVDYLHREIGRFDVVVNLLSHQHKVRLRVLCAVPGNDPTLPSLSGVYPGANFYEREGYDLLGVTFTDHPDLTRIMLPEDWEGHPLRKDESVGSVPVQFKGSNKVE